MNQSVLQSALQFWLLATIFSRIVAYQHTVVLSSSVASEVDGRVRARRFLMSET